MLVSYFLSTPVVCPKRLTQARGQVPLPSSVQNDSTSARGLKPEQTSGSVCPTDKETQLAVIDFSNRLGRGLADKQDNGKAG
jgi:hypothetical protein